MRPDPRAEGERWLSQSDHDLDAARYLREGGRHNLAGAIADAEAVVAALHTEGEEGPPAA